MMPPLIHTSPTSFQPICSFLYPRSCFTAKSVPAKALQISITRPYTRSTKTNGLTISSQNGRHGLFYCRAFATSTSNSYQARTRLPKMSQKSPQSYKVMVKEAVSKSGMPDDIGLFENTLIMPTGKSKPGIFSQPRLRAALEWYRLKLRVMDFGRLMIYKFTLGKPRPQLALRKTAKIAKELHAKMFKAFAEGDVSTLKLLCTSTLLQHFYSQIAARPPSLRYVWKIHKYRGRPQVVSHKAAIIAQGQASTGQRQAVVKIRSVQSLTKINENGGGTDDQQTKCEYIVIQQRHVEGAGPGEWQVWGTLSGNGWEEILERAGYEKLLNAAKGPKLEGVAAK